MDDVKFSSVNVSQRVDQTHSFTSFQSNLLIRFEHKMYKHTRIALMLNTCTMNWVFDRYEYIFTYIDYISNYISSIYISKMSDLMPSEIKTFIVFLKRRKSDWESSTLKRVDWFQWNLDLGLFRLHLGTFFSIFSLNKNFVIVVRKKKQNSNFLKTGSNYIVHFLIAVQRQNTSWSLSP